MGLIVRRAAKDDTRAVAEFALKLFAQHRAYDAERFAELSGLDGATRFYRSRIDVDEAAVLVAEIDGKVVGFAYLEYEAMNYAELLEHAVWLHDLYVEEGSRGSGAGKELVEAAVLAAREMGAEKIVLTVAAGNEAAQAFFEGTGFRRTMIEMTKGLTN